MKVLKDIDILGHLYSFENNGSSTHKTYQGACLSFLLYAFCTTVIIVFGLEVWERKLYFN